VNTDRRGTPTSKEPTQVNRRSFLGAIGAGAAATAALKALGAPGLEGGTVQAAEVGPQTNEARADTARQHRVDMAQLAHDRPLPSHPSNGDEEDYPYIGNFSKGLTHNGLGEVDGASYAALLAALTSGDPDDFEAIPLGPGGRKLTNPQAGLAFDLEGSDNHHLAIRPAPRFDSAEEAGEAAELYWMALLRDVSFNQYHHNKLAQAAAEDLTNLSDFRGPKQGGVVTTDTLFRGNTPGDLVGPYVSQFMLKDIPYGSLTISQRQQTVLPGVNFLTDYASWLAVQDGATPGGLPFDSVRRYIRNERDLTHYVHVDALYEAYLNACLILLGMGAPFDPGNPYQSSANQAGFGTFGGPHILSLVTEVATRALKGIWYQKWFVHRRLRPEEFGGRVHNHLSGAAVYPIHSDLLGSGALDRVNSKYGSYLLPQAYPEGSPTHPSYGAGHATVAGACVTILKAWFDESWVIPDPVVTNDLGTGLQRYKGADAGEITVGGELNKVAANVANARNMAGIHWKADYWESAQLGEAIAISILEEQKVTYNETMSFSLTKFDGTTITI
jgi:hypothetical protein